MGNKNNDEEGISEGMKIRVMVRKEKQNKNADLGKENLK